MNLNQNCTTMTVDLINYIQQHPNTLYHLNQFLIRYQNAIFNFIHLTIGDYHDSLDLTNKVLLTLSKKVKEIEVKKSFNFLVIKVIKGEISNYWKEQKSLKKKLTKRATIIHNGEETCLADTLESNEATAEEVLNLLAIRDIIENSGNPYIKEIFLLKYRDDESILDIAKKLKLTEYQVKKYLEEIQKNVKKYLEEIENEK